MKQKLAILLLALSVPWCSRAFAQAPIGAAGQPHWTLCRNVGSPEKTCRHFVLRRDRGRHVYGHWKHCVGTRCTTWPEFKQKAPPAPTGYWTWVNATGYDLIGPTANKGWSLPAQYGVCAAHPWIFPYGTVIYAPGYGTCVIEDTGGGIGEPWIDFWFPTPGQCFAWTGPHRILVETRP